MGTSKQLFSSSLYFQSILWYAIKGMSSFQHSHLLLMYLVINVINYMDDIWSNYFGCWKLSSHLSLPIFVGIYITEQQRLKLSENAKYLVSLETIEQVFICIWASAGSIEKIPRCRIVIIPTDMIVSCTTNNNMHRKKNGWMPTSNKKISISL